MNQAEIISSPAIANCLSHLRSVETDVPAFRVNADRISLAIGFELAKDLPTTTHTIRTPLTETPAEFTRSNNILLVAVLRSGLPLCRGLQQAMPDADLALIDIKRDESNATPYLYYDGLPQSFEKYDRVYFPDPMLATGGSTSMAIEMAKQRGAKNIYSVSIISAPEGIERLKREYPDVKIATCAIDRCLNEKKYIVPGLGDFGDRYFGDGELTIRDELKNQTLTYQHGRLQVLP